MVPCRLIYVNHAGENFHSARSKRSGKHQSLIMIYNHMRLYFQTTNKMKGSLTYYSIYLVIRLNHTKILTCCLHTRISFFVLDMCASSASTSAVSSTPLSKKGKKPFKPVARRLSSQ